MPAAAVPAHLAAGLLLPGQQRHQHCCAETRMCHVGHPLLLADAHAAHRLYLLLLLVVGLSQLLVVAALHGRVVCC
jgi:hypothetical protein